MVDVGALVRRGADVEDAASTFDPEVRRQYMNASEAMSCIRKQWYEKHADPSSKDGPESWGYARRGKAGERYIVENLRRANVPMLFTGDDQIALRDDDRRISATPDGLLLDVEKNGWLVCEFKTIDPRTNRDKLPKNEHVTQVQIAAAMFIEAYDDFPEFDGLPIVGCCVVYMDASNFDDIIQIPVPLAPKVLDRLEGRANRVLDSKSASRLPREGAQTPFKAECKQRCMWNGLCGVDGVGSSTGQGKAGAGDVEVQIGTYIDAKAAEDAAKARKAEAAEQLKAILKREGVSALDAGGHTVKVSERAGSVSYAKVVKDHCPDVDLEEYRGAPSETLTVK